jgi:hypothetical protein
MIMVEVQLLVEILRVVSQAIVLILLVIELVRNRNRR